MVEMELLTITEVAAILRVHSATIRRWITEGALEAVILPHAHVRQGYRIRKATVDALLQNNNLPQH